MKKLIALLMILSLFTVPALAEIGAEESAPLTYEELDLFLSALAKDALSSQDLTVEEADGAYWAQSPEAILMIADEEFTDSTALLGAVIQPGQEDLRGLKIGDSLDALLAAYPNDNPQLSGTRYDAALYIRGEMPEMSLGYVQREGQRISLVCHLVESWTRDGVIECGVYYGLDQGSIVDIRILGMQTLAEDADVQETLSSVGEMQENTAYFDYAHSPEVVAAPFQREDLSFSGIDFLDLTPEDAIAAFGEPQSDEWTEDSTGEYFRRLSWEGVAAQFLYSAEKRFSRVDALIVTDPDFEGPRGVRAGDYAYTVVARFPQTEGNALTGDEMILYGDGETAPYGLVSSSAGSLTITYAFPVSEDQTVLWYLVFTGSELTESRMLMR